MNLFGMGPTELAFLGVIAMISFVPSVLGAIGMWRIAQRAGYQSGLSTWWAVGYVFLGWLVVLILGFVEWPRDQAGTTLSAAPDAPSA